MNDFIFKMNEEKINECFNNIKKELDSRQQRIDNLIKENSRLKSENYKDEELKKLKEKLEEYINANHRTFTMEESEYQEYRDFVSEHYEKHNKERLITKANGNISDLTISGTGLGIVWKCQCKICGEKKEIADISKW